MMYHIDGVTYARWDDDGPCGVMDESFVVHLQFSKRKNRHVLVKNPTKTTIKAVKATDVGKNTGIVSDVLLKPQTMLSLKTDIQPILQWVSFPMTETDPNILRYLIDGSRVTEDGTDLQIPRIWCWKHLFGHKFHHLTLVEVNDEICVSLSEWVEKTPALRVEFGHDPTILFEHDRGPGVCDVEIVDDTIYVKVMYLI